MPDHSVTREQRLWFKGKKYIFAPLKTNLHFFAHFIMWHQHCTGTCKNRNSHLHNHTQLACKLAVIQRVPPTETQSLTINQKKRASQYAPTVLVWIIGNTIALKTIKRVNYLFKLRLNPPNLVARPCTQGNNGSFEVPVLPFVRLRFPQPPHSTSIPLTVPLYSKDTPFSRKKKGRSDESFKLSGGGKETWGGL